MRLRMRGLVSHRPPQYKYRMSGSGVLVKSACRSAINGIGFPKECQCPLEVCSRRPSAPFFELVRLHLAREPQIGIIRTETRKE